MAPSMLRPAPEVVATETIGFYISQLRREHWYISQLRREHSYISQLRREHSRSQLS